MSNYSSDEETDQSSIEKDLLVGQILNDRYIILDFINCGSFSSIFLSYDKQNNIFVSIKIQGEKYTKEAKNEYEKIVKIKTNGVVQLLDTFMYNKRRFCFVYPVLGYNLDELFENTYFTYIEIKKIIISILTIINDIHKKYKILHGDIKLSNIMFTELPPYYNKIMKIYTILIDNNITDFNLLNSISHQYLLNKIINKDLNVKLKINTDQCINYIKPNSMDINIIDFGSSNNISNNKKVFNIGTIYYNSPEILIETKYDDKIDSWAICCCVYEMITNKVLFNIDKLNDNKRSDEHNMLLMIYDIIGEIDGRIFQNGCEYDTYFDEKKHTLIDSKTRKDPYLSLTQLLKKNIKHELNDNDFNNLYDFLKNGLRINPKNRYTVEQLLLHPFITGQPYLKSKKDIQKQQLVLKIKKQQK